MKDGKQKVHPFLMFEGQAEAAMDTYISIFEDSEVVNITRYGEDGDGEAGTVMQAIFSIKGQEIMCIDSYVKHNFTFTPALSLFVTCDSEVEIDRVFKELAKQGNILMPLAVYPFSKKFGWISDKFGVTWQLSLE